MTTTNWLTIVLIISSFIAQLAGPLMAELVRSRISQPKPIPEPNQPKMQTGKNGARLRRLINWQVPLCVILLNVGILFRELLDRAPVTRIVVLIIAMAVGSVVFGTISIVVHSLSDELHRARY